MHLWITVVAIFIRFDLVTSCAKHRKVQTPHGSPVLLTNSSRGEQLMNIKDIPVSMCLASHKTNPHSYKRTIELQHPKYANITKSEQRAHGYGNVNITDPVAETRRVVLSEGDRYLGTRRDNNMLFTIVNNPHRTLTVLEPGHPGGCRTDTMYTVMETAKQKNCLVAVNGGFFENTGFFGDHIPCLGSIFSDGRLGVDSNGAQSAHFGITRNGYLHFGYLSKSDLEVHQYEELIGGAFWIIRDGEVYITESINIECQDKQQAETMAFHANTVSARTVVGQDKDGRVLIMQVDGRTGQTGFTLYEFAEILLDYGFVQAINLDGGGSATYVVDGVLANYPSDKCKSDPRFNCPRNVSTVLCVHRPEKFPYMESDHIEVNCKTRCGCDVSMDTPDCITYSQNRSSEYNDLLN